LPNTLKKTGHQTAERLRNLLDKTPIIINSVITLAMKISVGVSVIKSTDERFQDLHTRSDIALYKA
jgi:PleD family two-component response regulator